MRTRRRIQLFALPVVVAAGFVVGAWLFWPRTAITWENAHKVTPGMALEEVEGILGGPARNDTTGMVSYCLTGIEGFDPGATRPSEWISDEVLVMVYLDANQRVQRCVPVAVRRENTLEAVRRKLGL
jgi:hypothetical protein